MHDSSFRQTFQPIDFFFNFAFLSLDVARSPLPVHQKLKKSKWSLLIPACSYSSKVRTISHIRFCFSFYALQVLHCFLSCVISCFSGCFFLTTRRVNTNHPIIPVYFSRLACLIARGFLELLLLLF
uniref:Uncharacterized protein n=1 Tax=Trypanosoma brucei TaxID=5691 RepID=Q581L2_9TRYP|nr:hypothetical protein, unlikely [Trypanosoma brucei]